MLPEYPGWLKEMGEYARFVADPRQAEQSWLNDSSHMTSIFGPYELVGQLLIDMDAKEAVNTLAPQLQNMPTLRDSLLDFIFKTEQVEESLLEQPIELDVEQFLHGIEWQRLSESAMQLVQHLREERILS